MVPSPATFAKSAVTTIGVQDNTFGYFWHAFQVPYVARVHNAKAEELVYNAHCAPEILNVGRLHC
jgi:hypothetical protein